MIEVPHRSIDISPVPFSFGLSKKYWKSRGREGIDLLRRYEKELDGFVKEGRRNILFKKYFILYELNENKHIILE